MPIICIGPVCVPITAIIPILLFIFKPIYVRLPIRYQQKIDYGIKQCQLALNRCLRKIGWSKSKKKKTDQVTPNDKPVKSTHNINTSNNNNNNNTNMNNRERQREREGERPLIKEMEDEDEWDELLEKSTSQNQSFIAYFTSPWCKSCKAFYPIFEDLCNKYKSKFKFIKVDIDEFDEVALEYKVSALPTFIRFSRGKITGSVYGPNKEQLEGLFAS